MVPNRLREDLVAALTGLTLLQGILLVALYAQVPPHPPNVVAPLIAMAFAVGVISTLGCWWQRPFGAIGAILTALCGLISFGPHKFFTPAAIQIAPVVFLGLALSLWLLFNGLRAVRFHRGKPVPSEV